MRVRAIMIALGLGAAMSPVPAQAQELSAVQSSGSFSITVVIPPFAAALAAQRAGAAGLWTIDDASDGLMVNLPSIAAGETVQPAAIFNGANTVFSAAMEPNAFVELTSEKSETFNGLRRYGLSFHRIATTGEVPVPAAVTMVIAGV